MAMMRPPTETTMPENTRILEATSAHDSDSPKKKGSVQVKLELGHKAVTRKKPTPEGFTHDWTMFVRGPEGSNIQHFVDRVIFFLHDSFPKPKRVVKEPPYQINESGYAGFNLPIEIHFKNKEEPKKITFAYDLFLHTPHSPPVNHVRCEKLTFQNPSDEFRRKLLKAGGVAILGPNDQSLTSQVASAPAPSPTPSLPQTPESKAFADLFGAPLKNEVPVKKHKSSSSKDRSGGRNKSTSSSQGSGISPVSSSLTSTPPSTTTPPSTPVKEQTKPHGSGSGSKHNREKSNKRSAESSSVSEGSKKKKKENDSAERQKEREERKEREKQEREKEKRLEKEKEKEKKEKEKERKKEKKSSSKESKSKHKSSRKETEKSKNASPKVSKSSPAVAPHNSPPPAAPPQPEVRTLAAKKAPPPILEDVGMGEIYGFDEDDMNMDIPADIMAAVCSPASTLSFSSMKGPSTGDGGGPLGALFAEMEDDEVPLSPLPVTSDSPPQTTVNPPKHIPPKEPEPVPEPPPKEPSPPPLEPKPVATKSKKRDKESRKSRNDRRSKEASKENKDISKDTTVQNAKDLIAKDLFKDYHEKEVEEKSSQNKTAPNSEPADVNGLSSCAVAPNGESLTVLLELQQRLMTMTDRDLVQQVVNVIEETGMYKISDATFDFDLCSLDINTVKKLQVCLEMVC